MADVMREIGGVCVVFVWCLCGACAVCLWCLCDACGVNMVYLRVCVFAVCV